MNLALQFGPLLGTALTDEQLASIRSHVEVGFAKTIGLHYTKLTPDEVRAEFTIAPEFCQPMGLTHGGIYASIVEDVASVAANWWLAGKAFAVGANNSTDFIRPLQSGKLLACATPIHRGRTQQLWQVDITTEDSKLAAQGRLRLSNIPVDSHS